MIQNGWIFPDGSECEIHNTADSYKDITVCFCRGYRFCNVQKSIELQQELQDLLDSDTIVSDWQFISSLIYSVKKLHWIAIMSYGKDQTVILHSSLDWQKPIIEEYKKSRLTECCSFGYVDADLEECDILSIILNGERRFSESGEEFRYDGTDEEDYFIDADGQILPVP